MTIRQIAQQLNLSMGTVSKALNDAPDISEETKALVCEFARKTGYRVGGAAKSRIALLYQFMQAPYQNQLFYSVAAAFSLAASNSKYEIVTDTLANKDEAFCMNDYMEKNRFAGAFVLGVNFLSPVCEQLKEIRFPLVLLDTDTPENPHVASVGSNNIAAIRAAVGHLREMGHAKIGFLAGEPQSFVSSERFAAYILAIASAGLRYENEYVYFGDFTKECGVAAAAHFAKTDVSAIVCASDIMAIGLIDGLRARGVRVPEDISVIGFDDIELLRDTQYDLTTIRQDFSKIGETAFGMLCALIKGERAHRTVLPAALIKRGSVRRISPPEEA